MAIDKKYGRVTVEYAGPEEDEQVIVFRATDANVPNLLRFYYELCEVSGSPQHHLDLIKSTHDEIVQWQRDNPGRVRVPNSNRYIERIQKESESVPRETPEEGREREAYEAAHNAAFAAHEEAKED